MNQYTKNNDILSQEVLQLENLINNFNDDILIKRIRDIIITMKKSIDENRKNFFLLYQTLNNMNIKLDFLTMNQLGPKYEIKFYEETMDILFPEYFNLCIKKLGEMIGLTESEVLKKIVLWPYS